MALLLSDTINFSRPFIDYIPLDAGVNGNPAVTIASMIRFLMLNPPFTWPWNRAQDSSVTMTAGLQDYTVNLTDFGFLEKVTVTDPVTNETFELKDVYNVGALTATTTSSAVRQRPAACAVKAVTFGTSVQFRFIGAPDKAYAVTFIYQKLALPFANTAGAWAPIPDWFADIFNNLFLAEAFQMVDDPRATQFRQRGIATLLAKSEGLTDMQRNAFLEQVGALTRQATTSMMRNQQGNNARAV